MTREISNRWSCAADSDARILFVDDDMILAEFAKAHLTSPTTTVEIAFNGAEALDLLAKQSFDIILLDIEMPTLDGFGLLEKLRADVRFADLPVVMLTGRDDIASIDRAFQIGANSFITKPINWRQLSHSLRYVLRNTRIESELRRERKRSNELLQLTNNLLSLLKLESRTPLSAIIGFADCIRQEIDGPIGVETYPKYAAQITTAAQQLQGRLMDLVQYSQLSSGAARLNEDEYLAGKIVDAAVTGAAMLRRREITVDTVKPEDDFFLFCDIHWLARALTHLLEIAVMDDRVERIQCALRRDADGSARFVLTATRNKMDAPANQTLGAEPTSLESVRREMGVGVPFARRIAELHDGELIVRAEAGQMEIVIPAKRVIPASSERQTIEAA